jgi:DNA polymerase
MVIGEAPGQDEDRTGRPFVGRAGQLLDKMLAAIGLDRHTNCFIANVVKCRPPENRDPAPGEIRSCAPFLNRHIACLRPRLILCLGRIAANTLLGNGEPAAIGSLRGRFFDYTPESRRPPAGTPPAGLPAPGLSAPGSPDSPETGGTGAAGAAETGGSPGEPEPRPVPLLATYHPSALLRSEDLKRPAWEDLKLLRSKLEETRGI